MPGRISGAENRPAACIIIYTRSRVRPAAEKMASERVSTKWRVYGRNRTGRAYFPHLCVAAPRPSTAVHKITSRADRSCIFMLDSARYCSHRYCKYKLRSSPRGRGKFRVFATNSRIKTRRCMSSARGWVARNARERRVVLLSPGSKVGEAEAQGSSEINAIATATGLRATWRWTCQNCKWSGIRVECSWIMSLREVSRSFGVFVRVIRQEKVYVSFYLSICESVP